MSGRFVDLPGRYINSHQRRIILRGGLREVFFSKLYVCSLVYTVVFPLYWGGGGDVIEEGCWMEMKIISFCVHYIHTACICGAVFQDLVGREKNK